MNGWIDRKREAAGVSGTNLARGRHHGRFGRGGQHGGGSVTSVVPAGGRAECHRRRAVTHNARCRGTKNGWTWAPLGGQQNIGNRRAQAGMARALMQEGAK